MKFSRLSKQAKEAARENERTYRCEHDQDWWDVIYEDAVTIGALMGIEIGTNKRRTMGNTEIDYPSIWFSGFSSQGDGACYEGRYYFEEGAPAKVRAHAPQDKALHRIADQLTALQIASRILGEPGLTANIKAGNRNYSHSHTMEIEVDDAYGEHYDTDTMRTLTQLLRDFADWIYGQLEAEYDHFTSDDAIEEYLKEGDLKFSSAGAIIPSRTSI